MGDPRLLPDTAPPDYKFWGRGAVWITVGNVSVHLKRGDEGVSVTLYPLDRENDKSLSETRVTYAEAERDESVNTWEDPDA